LACLYLVPACGCLFAWAAFEEECRRRKQEVHRRRSKSQQCSERLTKHRQVGCCFGVPAGQKAMAAFALERTSADDSGDHQGLVEGRGHDWAHCDASGKALAQVKVGSAFLASHSHSLQIPASSSPQALSPSDSTSPTSNLPPSRTTNNEQQTTNNIVVISELSRTPRRFPFATLSAPFSAYHALSPPLFRLLLWSSRQLIPQSPYFGLTRPALSPEHILRQPRPSPSNCLLQYLCHHVTVLQLRWTASPVAHECAHLP